MPPEALADLVERLVDVLDAAGPDPDAEPEPGACAGCDDFGTGSWRLNRLVRRIEGGRGAGDLVDAEEDNEDSCPAADDNPVTSRPLIGYGPSPGPGTPEDAEDAGDHEPDDGTGPDWQPDAPRFRRRVPGVLSTVEKTSSCDPCS